MKKRSTVLIILIAVMAVIIAAYFIISSMTDKNIAPPMTIETDPFKIVDEKPATIKALTFTHDGETLEFEFSDIAYKWYYKYDNKFPVEQSILQTMATVVSTIPAVRVIEETRDNFAQYGLDKPFMTVSATFQPEKESPHTWGYNVGNFNEFNSTYYFNIDGTDTVYAVTGAFVPFFDYGLLDLAVADTIPPFTTATFNIVSVDIDGAVITDVAALADVAAAFTKIVPGKPVMYEYDEELIILNNVVVDYTEAVSVANEDGSISTSVNAEKKFICRFGHDIDDGKTYMTINDSGLGYLVSTDAVNVLLGN